MLSLGSSDYYTHTLFRSAVFTIVTLSVTLRFITPLRHRKEEEFVVVVGNAFKPAMLFLNWLRKKENKFKYRFENSLFSNNPDTRRRRT